MIVIEDPTGSATPEQVERYRDLLKERAGYTGKIIVTSNLAEADLRDVPHGIWPGIEAGERRAVLLDRAPVLQVPDLYENRAARRTASRGGRVAGRRGVGRGLR